MIKKPMPKMPHHEVSSQHIHHLDMELFLQKIQKKERSATGTYMMDSSATRIKIKRSATSTFKFTAPPIKTNLIRRLTAEIPAMILTTSSS